MKIKEVLEKDVDGLKTELKEQLKHLFDLRTQSVTEKLEDPTQIGKTRRTIARIKTVLHQRATADKSTAESTAGKSEVAAK
jgi:large subunit ribosomal protein L29